MTITEIKQMLDEELRKANLIEEENRHRIIKHFESMTKEQIIKYIDDNLYFDRYEESWNIDTDEIAL